MKTLTVARLLSLVGMLLVPSLAQAECLKLLGDRWVPLENSEAACASQQSCKFVSSITGYGSSQSGSCYYVYDQRGNQFAEVAQGPGFKTLNFFIDGNSTGSAVLP